jgi:hypothetical protein
MSVKQSPRRYKEERMLVERSSAFERRILHIIARTDSASDLADYGSPGDLEKGAQCFTMLKPNGRRVYHPNVWASAESSCPTLRPVNPEPNVIDGARTSYRLIIASCHDINVCLHRNIDLATILSLPQKEGKAEQWNSTEPRPSITA